MLFCGKFSKVYVCQKLLKYTLFWQTYGKNKTVQFFCPTVYNYGIVIVTRKYDKTEVSK